LLGGGIATRYLAPDPRPLWTGGILFDSAVADGLSIRDEPARWTTAMLTDAFSYTIVSYRLLDGAIVPGLIHEDWEVAQQLTLIDLQAYAIVAAALWIPQAFIGRDRPLLSRCDDAEVRANELVCKPGNEHRYRSFVSGHVAMVVAAASLTCLHHANLPLYGGGAWDDVACAGAIGVAVSVAVGRTITLNHWATDVILGAMLGFGAGYLLPAALHYGFDGSGTGTSSAALAAQSPLVPLTFSASF
jgi:membrane-associated phospholipid phosphatase